VTALPGGVEPRLPVVVALAVCLALVVLTCLADCLAVAQGVGLRGSLRWFAVLALYDALLAAAGYLALSAPTSLLTERATGASATPLPSLYAGLGGVVLSTIGARAVRRSAGQAPSEPNPTLGRGLLARRELLNQLRSSCDDRLNDLLDRQVKPVLGPGASPALQRTFIEWAAARLLEVSPDPDPKLKARDRALVAAAGSDADLAAAARTVSIRLIRRGGRRTLEGWLQRAGWLQREGRAHHRRVVDLTQTHDRAHKERHRRT
jgi:hypothetical protein